MSKDTQIAELRESADISHAECLRWKDAYDAVVAERDAAQRDLRIAEARLAKAEDALREGAHDNLRLTAALRTAQQATETEREAHRMTALSLTDARAVYTAQETELRQLRAELEEARRELARHGGRHAR